MTQSKIPQLDLVKGSFPLPRHFSLQWTNPKALDMWQVQCGTCNLLPSLHWYIIIRLADSHKQHKILEGTAEELARTGGKGVANKVIQNNSACRLQRFEVNT